MSAEQQLAEKYFELSNNSSFDEIAALMTPETTYSSANTGVYLGVDQILDMQRQYHGGFSRLHWTVESVDEVRPGVILFDYNFSAERPNGEIVEFPGLEYVIVKDDRILHVDIRNK